VVCPPGTGDRGLGPNGAGKTTTVECAEGLQRRTRVRSAFWALTRGGPGPTTGPCIGVMLQDGGLPGGTKPVRLLRHLAGVPSVPRRCQRARGPARDRRLHRHDRSAGCPAGRSSASPSPRLSVGRPEVAFLDEPTAGWTPRPAEVWDLVREPGTPAARSSSRRTPSRRRNGLADHIVIVSRGRWLARWQLAELTRGTFP
jgi:ABC-2 type transport system ATP-binding protein